jgi:hypothetical protein
MISVGKKMNDSKSTGTSTQKLNYELNLHLHRNRTTYIWIRGDWDHQHQHHHTQGGRAFHTLPMPAGNITWTVLTNQCCHCTVV